MTRSASRSHANLQHVKTLALIAIRLYQRFLSPYKGFCCAYAALTGRASCSALGYRAIRRFGVRLGLAVLDQRLHRCSLAARRPQRLNRYGPLSRQAGSVSCDLPCDVGDACDALDCASECRSWYKKRWRRVRGDIPPRREPRPPPRYPPTQS